MCFLLTWHLQLQEGEPSKHPVKSQMSGDQQLVISLMDCKGSSKPSHSRVLPIKNESGILQDKNKRSFAWQSAPGKFVLARMADLADFATIYAPPDPRYAPLSIAWELLWAPCSQLLAIWAKVPSTCRKPGPGDLSQTSPTWLHVFKASNGQLLHSLALRRPLVGDSDGLSTRQMAWSPDSRQLAFWGCPTSLRGCYQDVVVLLDVTTGKVLPWWGDGPSWGYLTMCHWIRWPTNSQWLVGYVGMRATDPRHHDIVHIVDSDDESEDDPEILHAFVIDAANGFILHSWSGFEFDELNITSIRANTVYDVSIHSVAEMSPRTAADATALRKGAPRVSLRCIISEVPHVSDEAKLAPCGTVLVDCTSGGTHDVSIGDMPLSGQFRHALYHFCIAGYEAHIITFGDLKIGHGVVPRWFPHCPPHRSVYALTTGTHEVLVVDVSAHAMLMRWSLAELVACATGNAGLLDTLQVSVGDMRSLAGRATSSYAMWSPDGRHLLVFFGSEPPISFIITF